MKIAVTVVLAVILGMVHIIPDGRGQVPQPPNVEGVVGVAVNVIVVPLTKPWLHVPALDAQLRPGGELVTIPVPVPEKSTVSIGPELLRQATFAVI